MRTEDSLKDTLEKLVERAQTDEAARDLLSRLEEIDQVLRLVESEDHIVLPYSTMPKISNRCWK